jgi:hypothetical protein
MPWASSACALQLIRLANRSPGPGSRCAARRIAVCELLMIATVLTLQLGNHSLFLIVTSSASPIAPSSASNTFRRPVPRKLRRDLHSFPCLHTAAAPTWSSSEHDPSVHHIQTPAPTLASFSLAQRCAALLAAVSSSSMMVLTTDYSPRAGQFMPSAVRPCWCPFCTALHISAPEVGFWCSSFNLLLHAFASLAVNLWCLESKITGGGVSPASLISAPRGIVGSGLRIDLACQFRRSWRSSRLPTSLGSYQSSLPYSATGWMQAIWTALTFSGTTPYVFVRVRSLASAALAFFMH